MSPFQALSKKHVKTIRRIIVVLKKSEPLKINEIEKPLKTSFSNNFT
tara:strand:- start:590 stop:730 length:141 start_codon:yes stop_codon:yes gene_type:complete